MSNTTANSMNLHLQKVDTKIDVRLSSVLKNKVIEMADAQNMEMSEYARLALSEKVESDSAVTA